MKQSIILLALLCPLLTMCQPPNISGRVINDQGEPLIAATVTLHSNNSKTITNNNGQFSLRYTQPTAHDSRLMTYDSVTISAIGYESISLPVSHFTSHVSPLTITLSRKITALDDVIIMAYGTTTRRLNTGNIAKLSATDIQKQPVSDPLLALSGRIPGLLITQSNGLAGSSIKVQLRGQNSITQGSDPLFIIDGVPYANEISNQFTSALGAPSSSTKPGGLSPFFSINPADIESIEILKDADATAIYGSRGANGVIIITTRKGSAGKTKLTINAYSGFSKASRLPSYMTTQQYIAMRKEAFANDGITPTAINAPDLLLWDTTRYTDLKQLMLGNTARTNDIQLSVSGGNTATRFILLAGYHNETTIFPGDQAADRISFRAGIDHTSTDKKFNLAFTGSYAASVNDILSSDAINTLRLPPNIPALYKPNGQLNWEESGTLFENPLAYLQQSYKARSGNLLGNFSLRYNLFKGFELKTTLGYNSSNTNEQKLTPLSAQNPAYSPTGYADFGNSRYQSWIIEPQVNYNSNLFKGKFNILLGSTFQANQYEASRINATGYFNDALLQSTAGAAAVSASNNFNEYRYNAIFTRLSYNLADRYLINITARRDGSSRFGPGKQFANFGAVGIGWIFSQHKFIVRYLPWLSFGKLRTSYGTAGNDQIGNYQYLSTWVNTAMYQGTAGLRPTRLYNPDYRWEINRKWEAALETGWFNDRVLFTVAAFRNRSSNQLTNYALPSQTGFTSVIQNLDALVQNHGWEFSLATKNIKTKKWEWTSSLNLTIHRNKLIAFPGLASSSYAATFVEGQPLNLIYALHYTGIDPATGVYTFQDVNSDGSYTIKDYKINGTLDPRYYAGLSNTIQYGNWSLDIFFDFRKQQGRSFLATIGYPGSMMNQVVQALDRWQKPGDKATLQRYTAAVTNNPATIAQALLAGSDAVYADASFIRCKTLSLSWAVPAHWMKRIKGSGARLYTQAQNLFTISPYKQSDPETQNLNAIPPLQTITIGMQVNF